MSTNYNFFSLRRKSDNSSPSNMLSPNSISLQYFFIIFIFLLLNIILYINIVPLFHEEPRRAIIAQEMLLSKNFIKPTVMGESYLKKPPLQNWLIALTSIRDKVISNFDARIPSVLAFILLGILILFLPIDRLIAIKASIFTISSYVLLFSYANKAEPDMLFVLFVFASYLFYVLKPHNILFIIISSIFMGASILTKGISPILFYPPMFFYIILFESSKMSRFKYLLLHFSLSLILPITWIVCLSFQTNIAEFFKIAFHEVFHRDKVNLQRYIYHLISYPFRILTATLPFSIVLCFTYKKIRNTEKVYLSALSIFIWIFLLFLLAPYGKGRYFMPAVPFFGIVAAYLLNEEKTLDINIRRGFLFIFSIYFVIAIPFYLFKGFFTQATIFAITLAFLYYYFNVSEGNVIKETLILLMIFTIGYYHGYYFYKSQKHKISINNIDKLKGDNALIVFDSTLKNNLKFALNIERNTKQIVHLHYNKKLNNSDHFYYCTYNLIYTFKDFNCENFTTVNVFDKKNKTVYIYKCKEK